VALGIIGLTYFIKKISLDVPEEKGETCVNTDPKNLKPIFIKSDHMKDLKVKT
jgi:hypothetical protein